MEPLKIQNTDSFLKLKRTNTGHICLQIGYYSVGLGGSKCCNMSVSFTGEKGELLQFLKQAIKTVEDERSQNG